MFIEQLHIGGDIGWVPVLGVILGSLVSIAIVSILMRTTKRQSFLRTSQTDLGLRFGSCKKCMALSVSFLVLSLIMLGAVWNGFPSILVFAASIASGLFATWTLVHLLMFVARTITDPRGEPAGRSPTRGCCK